MNETAVYVIEKFENSADTCYALLGIFWKNKNTYTA